LIRILWGLMSSKSPVVEEKGEKYIIKP